MREAPALAQSLGGARRAHLIASITREDGRAPNALGAYLGGELLELEQGMQRAFFGPLYIVDIDCELEMPAELVDEAGSQARNVSLIDLDPLELRPLVFEHIAQDRIMAGEQLGLSVRLGQAHEVF